MTRYRLLTAALGVARAERLIVMIVLLIPSVIRLVGPCLQWSEDGRCA